MSQPGRVFITGASGFLGPALAERYRARGVAVSGVDVLPQPELGIVAGDVSRPGAWQQHASGCDLFVHTAAIVNDTAPRPRCWEVNVLGTRRALDAAIAAGARRFVHLSSVRAFSDVDFPDGATEEHPVRPDGHRYVETKIASEQVALQAHAAGAIEVTIIRPGDVYGPGSKPWTLWPVLGIRNGSFAIPVGRHYVFSPVFVENLIDGIVLAAEASAGSGQVFTLSDGIAMPNAEFFGHYARMLGRPLRALPAWAIKALFASYELRDRLRRRPVGVNAATVDYFLRTGTYSIAKAKRVLGYEPRVGLAEGMARTEAWLRAIGLLPRDATPQCPGGGSENGR